MPTEVAGPDVVTAEVHPDELPDRIVDCIRLKGFCIIDAGLQEDILQAALEQVEHLKGAEHFSSPPELVLDGLLGEQQSRRIARLRSGRGSTAAAGDELEQLDGLLTELGMVIEYEVLNLGLSMHARSAGLLHESQAALRDGDGVATSPWEELTEQGASEWMAQLAQGRLLCALFLGPGGGKLELRPLDDAKAETFVVTTEPGMIVILRADTLSHRHVPTGPAPQHALSCFYYCDYAWWSSSWRSGRARKGAVDTRSTPAVRGLADWIQRRMRQLKEDSLANSADPWQQQLQQAFDLEDLPRGWLQSMDHSFHTGQRLGFHSLAVRFPAAWDPSTAFSAGLAGFDAAEPVPIMRWDHDRAYDANERSHQEGKTYAAHGAFMEGIDLFDPKPFGLSPSESRGMDPGQRLTLETGYEACILAGYRKRELMNAHGGVYVGCGVPEWIGVELQGEISSTGGSMCITANRFSFALGLKGPSVAIDIDFASSSVALHTGAMQITERGRHVPGVFSLMGGVYTAVTLMAYLRLQALGSLSRLGRCLAFDTSADGMLKGEGCSYVLAKPHLEFVDGKPIVKESATEALGFLAGSHAAHAGKGPMGACNGASLKALMAECVQICGISPLAVEAVECNGTGQVLNDAVEATVLASALRPGSSSDEALGLLAGKTHIGHLQHCAGMAALARLLYGTRGGRAQPSLGLVQVNPHINCWDDTSPVVLPVEAFEHKFEGTYAGSVASSYMGMQASLVLWNRVQAEGIAEAAAPALAAPERS